MAWLPDDLVKVYFLQLMKPWLISSASKFGAVLDMVTDRCTTACLLCYLCSAYPSYTVYFQTIISVDLASHYMHMYRYNSSASSTLYSLAYSVCAIALSTKVYPLTRRFRRNRVGFCDSTMATISFFSCFALAMSSSSSQSIFYHSRHRQTRLLASVRILNQTQCMD